MDLHYKYATKNHHHFDFTYRADDGFEYPDSGLMLVQCGDDRWIIVQEFGDEYGRFPGVVKSREDWETEPTFYTDIDAAARSAFALIKQIYPSTPDERLSEFFED